MYILYSKRQKIVICFFSFGIFFYFSFSSSSFFLFSLLFNFDALRYVSAQASKFPEIFGPVIEEDFLAFIDVFFRHHGYSRKTVHNFVHHQAVLIAMVVDEPMKCVYSLLTNLVG